MYSFESTGLAFDRDTGNRLRIEDVFSAQQIARILPALASAVTGRENPHVSRSDIRWFTESDSWLPLDEGLWVEVDTYMFGAKDFEVTVPWQELYLDSDANEKA